MPVDSKGSSTITSSFSFDYSDDKRMDERVGLDTSCYTRENTGNLKPQEQSKINMKNIVVDSVCCRPLMTLPTTLTKRQEENKILIENHKRMGKKLNARAQIAKDAANRTKLLIHHFKLLEKTDSSLPKKNDTTDNMRDLDKVNYELELEAKRQALSLLHLFTKKEMSSTHVGQLV